MVNKGFSLNYLYKENQQVSKKETDDNKLRPIDKAVILYSRKLLGTLKKTKRANLHDIAKTTNIKLKDILEIMPYLESSGFVKVIQPDNIIGNDLVEITDEGEKLIT